MRINFLVNEVFNGWEPTDTRLGGTEESVVRWAEELARRGYTVFVYHNPRTEDWDDFTYTEGPANGTYNGVWYCPRKAYTNEGAYEPEDKSVCINIKSSEVPPKEPTIYLTNETNADTLDLSLYDAVVWPSQWAKDHISVNNPNVFIVPHGYDPEKIYPGKKIPKQCFYASSPDRGLDTLLEAWPKVVAEHPDATLLLTYGAKIEPMQGVINLGEVDEETMNEIYRTSDIWCHPCSGGELYCITGIKAQAAGCVPVIIPTMALAETVKSGFFAKSAEDYADTLIRALGSNTINDNVLRESARFKARLDADTKSMLFPTWADSTDKLMKVIENVIK